MSLSLFLNFLDIGHCADSYFFYSSQIDDTLTSSPTSITEEIVWIDLFTRSPAIVDFDQNQT